ncbi:MAG: hypothetical protein IT381_28600 [Deltaproteobacteria bacterium]|nr:hypothetical protein [Deltaproteobacteria bacterium]
MALLAVGAATACVGSFGPPSTVGGANSSGTGGVNDSSSLPSDPATTASGAAAGSSGATGATSATGVSGVSGVSGASGASGASGGSGPSGYGVYGREAVAAFDALGAGEKESIKTIKVLFHHHSVGENIMGFWTDDSQGGGAEALGFTFAEANTPADFSTLTLAHTTGGDNGDPVSKLDSFESIIVTQAFGAAVRVAVFKFCYIDFGGGSSVQSMPQALALEASYRATMQAVSAAHPGLRIVHVTPPLMNYWNSAGNDLRAELGRFMRDEYGANGFVFDLQDLESHDATGALCSRNGVAVICDPYVGNSGHLTGLGSTRAAKGLLYTLWRAGQQ